MKEFLDSITEDDISTVKDTFTGCYLLKKAIGCLQWLNNKRKEKFKQNTEKLGKMTDEKLKNVQPDEIVEPNNRLAFSIIQLNALTDNDTLREMFSNLLAASMQKDRTNQAHVSFVRVLEQLSPSEALLLKTTKLLVDNVPVARISYQKTDDFDEPIANNELMLTFTEGQVMFEHYTLLGNNFLAKEVAFFLENLARLNLIKISYESYVTSANAYSGFVRNSIFNNIEQKITADNLAQKNSHLVYNPGVISPTIYGREFYEVCVK